MVVLEDFTVAGEVVLFQGGGGQGGFGVEETGELRDEGLTLGWELVRHSVGRGMAYLRVYLFEHSF